MELHEYNHAMQLYLLVSEKINHCVCVEKLFKYEDANGNKEKEARLTQKQSIGLVSNLMAASSLNVKSNKAIKRILFFSLTGEI